MIRDTSPNWFIKLAKRWWNLDLELVTDKSPPVPKVSLIREDPALSAGFSEFAQKLIASASLSGRIRVERSPAGFTCVAAPISDPSESRCVFVQGFVQEETAHEQKHRIRSVVERLTSDAQAAQALMDETPLMTPAEYERLLDILEALQDGYRPRSRTFSEEPSLEGAPESFMVIGESAALRDVMQLVEKVAIPDLSVLITGENGTGKEVIAKSVHRMSKRSKRPFIAVNCGALSEHLLDSELFGHVKGSFTGALSDKKGLFEEAHGGTLFLDEIGDTSPMMQVKLLRVLQDGTFIPVGSAVTKTCNVRVIAATNRDLVKMVETGEFRQDLYYRLRVVSIDIPPLRQRSGDVRVLAEHFLDRYMERHGVPKRLTNQTLDLLGRYGWPGNVRELENEIERLCVLSGDAVEIEASLISAAIQDQVVKKVGHLPLEKNLKAGIEEKERGTILQGLRKHKGNKSKVARELGLSRATLLDKINKYKIEA